MGLTRPYPRRSDQWRPSAGPTTRPTAQTRACTTTTATAPMANRSGVRTWLPEPGASLGAVAAISWARCRADRSKESNRGAVSVTWHAQDMSHEAHSRILVVGDLHENTGAGLPSPSTAGALGADLLLQVGVFGYWSPSASRAGTVVDTATMNDSAGSTRFPSEMMAVAASPTTSGTLPRGFGWQCGDTSRSGGGGAVSVDKASASRAPHGSRREN